MAIAFAGIALLVGLTFGFGKIEKPAQDGVKTTDEESAGGVQDLKEEVNIEL
jgi:hypothetical protein